MQYLYKGSTDELSVEAADILELMAAANFFQLDGLLQYCEVRCASLIDLDNIVSYYIHAKVRFYYFLTVQNTLQWMQNLSEFCRWLEIMLITACVMMLDTYQNDVL